MRALQDRIPQIVSGRDCSIVARVARTTIFIARCDANACWCLASATVHAIRVASNSSDDRGGPMGQA